MTFRGVIAPASLKPEPGRGMVAAADGFPGRYRPGLIEAPPAGRAGGPSSSSFPGRYRPGLIEARFAFTPSTAAAALSGALSPRPH